MSALFAGGLDAFKTGDFETSVEYLKKLLGLQPTSAKAKTEFLGALIADSGNSLSKGNLPQEISAYTEAVKLSPTASRPSLGLPKHFGETVKFPKPLRQERRR
jgi:tetratricopeptide (TPR) repeat protein